MKIEYTKENLENVIKDSNSLRQVLLKFNRNQSSRSYDVLNKKIDELSIDISHFLSNSERAKLMFEQGLLFKRNEGEMFISGSSVNRSVIKKRLITEKLLDYKCFNCGNEGEWMDKPMVLILDHKNGVNNDNRIENLRFVCPNCNSQLETHCKGSKVFKPIKPKIDKRKLNHDRVETRKVEWPSKNVLIDLLKNMTYIAIGEKYGVSDNAVRKWCKKYEIL